MQLYIIYSVEELLSTIGDSDFTADESQQNNDNEYEHKQGQMTLTPQSSNTSTELMLDPYNAQHMEWMQQQIINLYSQDMDDLEASEMTTNNVANTKDTNNIFDDIESVSYLSLNAINTISIGPSEYRNIDEFNQYLSQILLNIIKYAEINNQLYRMNGHKHREKRNKHKKYRSSYDEIIQHIPPHSHYAFNPSLSPSSSFTDGVSQKYSKSKIFRSSTLKNENIEIIEQELESLNIDHCVNIESLKLIHDIIQLNKLSLKSISLQFKLYEEHDYDNDVNEQYDGDTESDDEHEQKSNMSQRERLFQLIMPSPNQNILTRDKKTKKSQSLQELKVNYDYKQNRNQHYESNMMISCISSILKLCERMKNLERFNFRLIDFNRECYDYFTHFDVNSEQTIFPNLKYLTIHIDDHLSQTEVSSFPFYAFAASPILAFLKKLKSLQSISIIIDDIHYKKKKKKRRDSHNNDENMQQQQYPYQFTIYWIKKLCEKMFEILNKNHHNLQEFYFKNTRIDCGTSECFQEMLINFIKNHVDLVKIHIILHDFIDENLSLLIQSMYATESKWKYKSCINNLEELKLVSKTCIDYAHCNNNRNNHNQNDNIQRSLRHHYGDHSLSALLHLIYNCSTLRSLSLICFYGADTIKFNALISAIKHKKNLNYLEIAQLRKDNDTLYSLSKLFKQQNPTKKHHRHKTVKAKYNVNWSFYQNIKISFGVEFRHFYHGEKLQIYDMKQFINLILQNQILLNENKLNLLKLIESRIDKSYHKLFCVPPDVLSIVVEFCLGLDSLNVELLQWNLFDAEELFLLFQGLMYFKEKYQELIQDKSVSHHHNKTNYRKIKWFNPNWFNDIIAIK